MSHEEQLGEFGGKKFEGVDWNRRNKILEDLAELIITEDMTKEQIQQRLHAQARFLEELEGLQ